MKNRIDLARDSFIINERPECRFARWQKNCRRKSRYVIVSEWNHSWHASATNIFIVRERDIYDTSLSYINPPVKDGWSIFPATKQGLTDAIATCDSNNNARTFIRTMRYRNHEGD